MKPGRNDPCPCGSGKKYKHCCANLSQTGTPAQSASQAPTASEQNHLIALYKAERYAELEQQVGLLLQCYPDSSFGWKILSGALMAQGKDALLALQQTAKLLPQDAEVLNNLGDLLAKREQLHEAEECFRKAIQISPRYTDALYNLGQILTRQDRHPDAEQYYRKVIELKPHDANTHHNLGLALRMQQKFDEAESCFKQVLALKPDFAEAHQALGGQLVEQGQFTAATAYFRHALEIRPDYVMPRFALVNTKKIHPEDEDFAALIQIEKKTETLSPGDLTSLHFALGKCFDDTEKFDEAFTHYIQGCRIKRTSFNYDPAADTKLFKEIMRIFSTEKIEQLRDQGDTAQQPAFILGMPRSGTTLTEQILASHPDIHGAGELPDLLAITQRSIAGATFPENLHLLDSSRLKAWGSEYATSLRRHAPNALRITDKMPLNFLVVGLIHLMLPNAKIIHVRRNPVDTCISCFTMLFEEDRVKFSYDLSEIGQFYVNYARLMDHWRSVLPSNSFLEVEYEDLVQNTEEEARRLVDYCGLEWDADCLEFHKHERSVRTASRNQVRQPVYRSSMERWRRYEKHLAPLFDALGDLAPNR